MNKKKAIALLAGKKFRHQDWDTDESAIVTQFSDTRMTVKFNDGGVETIPYGKSRHYTILGDAVSVTDEKPRPYTFEELAKKVKKGTVLLYGKTMKNGVRYGKAITGISTHQLFQFEGKWYNTTELFDKFFDADGKAFGVHP